MILQIQCVVGTMFSYSQGSYSLVNIPDHTQRIKISINILEKYIGHCLAVLAPKHVWWVNWAKNVLELYQNIILNCWIFVHIHVPKFHLILLLYLKVRLETHLRLTLNIYSA